MLKIHDSGYKRLFSNKVIFRQLMETFVPEKWVQDLDFESCETIDKSFISEHYKETESDIIYKLKLKDKEVYIYIIIEFQSEVQRFMALRVLNYISNFYMDYLETNKMVKKLPAVFPIVLYNGDKKWTAPAALSSLIAGHELLGRYGISFEYFKIAENEYSKEALLRIRNIVSTLFLAEAHYDLDLLREELLLLFEREEDKQAVSLFLNWFKQLAQHGKLEQSDYESFEEVYESKQEVREMLIKAIEKEKRESYEKGMEKGMEKGKLQTAKAMLAKGMEISVISEVTGLSEEQISKLKARS